jgi:hypothetical protein
MKMKVAVTGSKPTGDVYYIEKWLSCSDITENIIETSPMWEKVPSKNK